MNLLLFFFIHKSVIIFWRS